jgi:hypothetical protein
MRLIRDIVSGISYRHINYMTVGLAEGIKMVSTAA